MSAFPVKFLAFTCVLAFFSGNVLAQTAPLAVAPDETAISSSKPINIIPQPSGLALPPDTVGTSAPPKTVEAQPASPIAPPVESTPLTEVKKDSVGLLAKDEGGLGAGLWNGTSRSLVERFMPMLSFPLPYTTLNNLALRFLLTTAGSPEGDADLSSVSNLTSTRVSKLVELGHAKEAWDLVNIAGFDQIDETTLRHVSEAALVSSADSDVCAKLPNLITKHTGIEWQKLMVVCQLQAKDNKAAQVSLDLLHAQGIHDETFYDLAEKNIIGGGKNLPRRLTPLNPLTLALLRLTDLPLREEVYAHPEPVLIPELLKTKAQEENQRIALAERAAFNGTISPHDLEDIYRSQSFTPDILSSGSSSGAQGPLLRAILFQASQSDTNTKKRIDDAQQFLKSLDQDILGGGMLTVLGDVIGDVPATPADYQNSVSVAGIYILAANNPKALEWLELARNGARGMPQVAAGLINLWPLKVLSGMESDKDFDKNLNDWLNLVLHTGEPKEETTKGQKDAATNFLLLMDAMGFPVTDSAWAKVAQPYNPEKAPVPPALVMQLLRDSATNHRKGESILMGLLAMNGGKTEPPQMAVIETIRSLRAVGLVSEAGNLAKDYALRAINKI